MAKPNLSMQRKRNSKRSRHNPHRAPSRILAEPLESRLLLSSVNGVILADASVENGTYADTNFGADAHLFVENPLTASANTQIAFLKFNIAGATSIGSAILQIQGKLENAGDPAIQTQVFAVADTSWVEGTGTGLLIQPANGITWNTQPAIGQPISNAVTISSTTAAIESFDLTAYVQQQRALGNNIISIAIESTTAASSVTAKQAKKTGAGIVEFGSREGTLAPQLAITTAAQGPIATLSAENIATARTQATAVAEYKSAVAIDLSTIVGGAGGNLAITGPAPASIGATTINSTNPDDVFVTYVIIPPNGSTWTYANNGKYTIELSPNQVKDVSGAPAASVSTTFSVSLPLPDTIPPAAHIVPATLSAATFSPEQITVVYTDNVAVDPATIAASNLSVTGPTGALTIASVSTSTNFPASTVTAVYNVDAPGAGWDYLADGVYTVTLLTNQVADTSANPAPTANSTLSVNISPPSSPLDLGFNSGAAVSLPFVAQASATLPSGEIVVVGNKGSLGAGNSQGMIELLTGNGALDTSFGNNGFVTTPVADNEAFYAVIPQDGGFVVGGTVADGGFLLQRYTLAGTLDPTFGTDGSAATNFGSSAQAVYSLAISPAGNIFAGGTASGNFAFAEYGSTGDLVSNWGQSGRQLFDLGSNIDTVGQIALQSNGDLIAVGSTAAQVAVVRLNAAGVADTSFGSGGLVVVSNLVANTAFTTGDRSEGLAIESDDSILVANQTPSGKLGVVHLDANGNLITTFGTNGLASADLPGTADADDVFVQPDGTIIATGTDANGGTTYTAVAEFTSAGTLVPGFGLLGSATLDDINATTSDAVVAGSNAITTFASQNSSGQVLLADALSTGQAALRRLAGDSPTVGSGNGGSTGTAIGSFGSSGHKNIKLSVPINGVDVTLSITGGTGEAYLVNNQLALTLNTTGKAASLNIHLAGGNKQLTLASLSITGSLANFSNRAVSLNGDLAATGNIGHLSLANLTSATITAGGNIQSISLLSSTDSTIAVSSKNKIAHIHVNSIDTHTLFQAGAFGSASIPHPVKPTSDSHFQII